MRLLVKTAASFVSGPSVQGGTSSKSHFGAPHRTQLYSACRNFMPAATWLPQLEHCHSSLDADEDAGDSVSRVTGWVASIGEVASPALDVGCLLVVGSSTLSASMIMSSSASMIMSSWCSSPGATCVSGTGARCALPLSSPNGAVPAYTRSSLIWG